MSDLASGRRAFVRALLALIDTDPGGWRRWGGGYLPGGWRHDKSGIKLRESSWGDPLTVQAPSMALTWWQRRKVERAFDRLDRQRKDATAVRELIEISRKMEAL